MEYHNRYEKVKKQIERTNSFIKDIKLTKDDTHLKGSVRNVKGKENVVKNVKNEKVKKMIEFVMEWFQRANQKDEVGELCSQFFLTLEKDGFSPFPFLGEFEGEWERRGREEGKRRANDHSLHGRSFSSSLLPFVSSSSSSSSTPPLSSSTPNTPQLKEILTRKFSSLLQLLEREDHTSSPSPSLSKYLEGIVSFILSQSHPIISNQT